ncbi:MAG: butyrate kinase [Flavobacteriales bacterium]|nr:butyrate kinase [Flavobacteriales bacterium]
MKDYISLIINPGSTSTKIGVYKNLEQITEKTIRHTAEELTPYADILDQFEFRKSMILSTLAEENIDVNTLDFIMARGGVLPPIPSGVYPVNDAMVEDLRTGATRHASNLAAIIALSMSRELGGIPAYIADPVGVDELQDVARVSGNAAFERKSCFHALNQKATAKKYAREIGKDYNSLSLIVVHMGGGVSVGTHYNGRVIDVNQAIDGEGPFSPERSGTLPMGDVIRMCYDGSHTRAEMLAMVNGRGGVSSYLGISDMREVAAMEEAGDAKATLVLDAMAYQIAKEIGAAATVLSGKVDAILLTGGIAYNAAVMNRLIPRVEFIAPVKLYPGEDELGALASAGLEVVRDGVEARPYPYIKE